MLLRFNQLYRIYNRFVFSIKRSVSSIIILFTLTSKSDFPKRSKLHSDLESMSETLKSRMFSSWPKRSCRIMSCKGQCRRKCSLSSFAFPQSQIGLKQSKLCRNLCSFRSLNLTRSFVNRLIPMISSTLNIGFLDGLIMARTFLLNSPREAEFLISLSREFHS